MCHSLQNIGAEQAEVAGVLNSGTYSESTLSDWLVNAPRHLLANNYGLPEARIAAKAGLLRQFLAIGGGNEDLATT